MFVTRSRYQVAVDEAAKLLDEVGFLREQYTIEKRKAEKLQKSIDVLYDEAVINAESKGRLAKEIQALQEELKTMQGMVSPQSQEIDLEEYLHPAPDDEEQRALYIARIAGWFNGGLRDYLKYLMSGFKSEISRFPLTERETDFFRSGINMCHLLLEWGDDAVAEHYANIQGEKNIENIFDSVDHGEDDSVKKIKEAVNN